MSKDWKFYAATVLRTIASNMQKGTANAELTDLDAKDVLERVKDLRQAAQFLEGHK